MHIIKLFFQNKMIINKEFALYPPLSINIAITKGFLWRFVNQLDSLSDVGVKAICMETTKDSFSNETRELHNNRARELELTFQSLLHKLVL